MTTINHVQFLTKYCNTLTDKPVSKHYRINLDLDDLNKARYPRMTQRATKRVPVLFMWCDRGQEAFVNVDLFQTTTNYSSFISLWLKMSFHRIFFSFKLTLSCLKSTQQTLWKASNAFLFRTQHECDVTMYR